MDKTYRAFNYNKTDALKSDFADSPSRLARFEEIYLRFTKNVSTGVRRMSAENLFDANPDEDAPGVSNGFNYSCNAPYDTDGGQYSVRLNARL
ncbi:hypothetical protein [Hyphomonas chukchiensis]|uniref:hypothetical protein n=1 Tax=Hyphomonas chukchiensis TaxID=1280947 RepID=UPI0030FAA66F